MVFILQSSFYPKIIISKLHFVFTYLSKIEITSMIWIILVWQTCKKIYKSGIVQILFLSTVDEQMWLLVCQPHPDGLNWWIWALKMFFSSSCHCSFITVDSLCCSPTIHSRCLHIVLEYPALKHNDCISIVLYWTNCLCVYVVQAKHCRMNIYSVYMSYSSVYYVCSLL